MDDISVFVFSQKTYAIYYNLTDEQIKEAVEYGENNKDTDYFTFLDEWMTVAGDGYEWAALNTKFSILAYEAKQAALKSRKLTQAEIMRFPLEVGDILSFHVILYGNSSDFAKDYHAVLLYKNKQIQPFDEQNDAHAKPANLGVRIPASYRAICKYDFPNYYIEPDAEIILVIISPLNKERMFVFHLKGNEMRVGFLQTFPVFGKKSENVDKAILQMNNLDADLMVLPELFNTGYQFTSREETFALAEKVPDGQTTQALINLAKGKHLYIVAGLAERENDCCYNSAVLVGPNGFIDCYRKLHLFYHEKRWFVPGNAGLGGL